MTAMNIHDESAWVTNNEGTEYTVVVPIVNAHLPFGALNVLMVCEGRGFSREDREHAQQRLDALPLLLDSIFARMRQHLGLSDSYEFHTSKGSPTLMLVAGDYNRWIFALDTVPQDLSLFVEWENDQIIDTWLTG